MIERIIKSLSWRTAEAHRKAEFWTRKLVNFSAPNNRGGDTLVSLYRFLTTQRRIPFTRNYLNDSFFKMKITKELEQPLRAFTSDKEYAKIFVKAVVGEEYCVPTIEVIRNKKAIREYEYPERCCIKPTHSSGRCFIRENGEPLPLEEFEGWFDHNYYVLTRERNYKHLVPKVIVEPLVFDCAVIEDYRFYCFNGAVKIINVSSKGSKGLKSQDFDREWGLLWHWGKQEQASSDIVARPANLARMIGVCEDIAQHFGLVRVDLYTDGLDCFVGEITHCDGGANNAPESRAKEERAAEILFSRS